MTRSIIEHVIQTLFDGRGLDSAESAFGRMEAGVRRADQTLGDLGNRAGGFSLRSVADTFNETYDMVSRVAGGLKTAWEVLDQGRVLEQTADRFDSLAQSIGSSSAELTSSLAAATQGALSQADAAASIGNLIEMGLIRSKDEAGELGDLIIRLKKPTDDATEAFGNFGAMLANQSIQRLDSFGISSRAVRTRIDQLMGSTEGLTREQAFLQAVMEEGRKTLERTGHVAGRTVSDYEVLNAKLADVKNAFLVAIYEGMEPFIGKAVEWVSTHGPQLVTMFGYVASVIETIGHAVVTVGGLVQHNFLDPIQAILSHKMDISQMGFGDLLEETVVLEIQVSALERQLRAAGVPTRDLLDYFGQLQGQYSGGFLEIGGDVAALRVYLTYLQNIAGELAKDDMPALTNATYGYSDATRVAREYNIDLADSLGQTHVVAAQMTANWQHSTVDLGLASDAWQAYHDRVQAVNDASREYYTTALQMEEPTFDLAGAVLASADAYGLSAGSLNTLLGAMGLFQENSPDTGESAAETAIKMAYLRLAIDEVTAAFGRNELSGPEAAAAIEEYERRANAGDYTPLNTQLAATLGLLQQIIANSTATIKIGYETGGVPTTVPAGPGPAQGPRGLPGSPLPPRPNPAGQPAYEYAVGGYTGAYGGLVHPGELVVPGYVLSGGAAGIVNFAQRHVPGGISAESGNTLIVNVDARGSVLTEEQIRAMFLQALVEAGYQAATYRAMR